MAVNYLGTQGLTDEMKTFYDRQLLERAQPNLVHARYGVEKTVPRSGGKSIEVRKMLQIPASISAASTGSNYGALLFEGSAGGAVTATFVKVTATLAQYGQWSQITDLVETQSFDPVINEFAVNYGQTMGIALDEVVRAALVAGTNLQYAGAATNKSSIYATTANMISLAEFREAVNTLKKKNIPPVVDGKYIAIIHPDTTRDLFAASELTQIFREAYDRGGANPMVTGVLGDYMGIRFVETTRAYTEVGGSPAAGSVCASPVYSTLVIGANAYMTVKLESQNAQLIVHPRGGHLSDPLEQYSTVGWKAAICAKILDENALVRILHATTGGGTWTSA